VVRYHWKMKFIEAQVAEARERVSEGGAAVWFKRVFNRAA